MFQAVCSRWHTALGAHRGSAPLSRVRLLQQPVRAGGRAAKWMRITTEHQEVLGPGADGQDWDLAQRGP